MFLRRIFGRKPKPPPPPEVKELSLDSLEGEIEKLRNCKLESIGEEVRPYVEGIAGARERIRASIKALSQAEVSEEVYVGLDRSVREARRLLIDKVTHAIDGIEQPKELTWHGLLAFDDSLGRAVNLMAEAGATHGRRASMLFGQQVRATYQSIERMQALAAEFRGIIEAKKEDIQTLDEISALIARQRGLIQKLAHLRAQIGELESRAEGLENILRAEQVELDGLTDSQELRQVERTHQELDQIERRIARLRGEAASSISNLQRPFKKMKKLVLDGKRPLGRDGVKMLDLCIDEPLEAFLSDGEDLPRLTALLKDLKDLIQGGQIELNPREREKRLEQIQDMLGGALLEMRREHDNALMEKAEKERACMSSLILKRRAELEKSLEVHRSELEKVRSELDELSEEMGKIEEEIGRSRSKLESEASIVLGVKLKIT